MGSFPETYNVSFTQYSSLDRKSSLRRQRVFTYPPLKFVVETFLFPRPRVFSSRPIKSLIATPLLAIALAGIRIGRILREKEDSHPLLTARKVSPDWSQKTMSCHSFNCFSIVWGLGLGTIGDSSFEQLLHAAQSLIALGVSMRPRYSPSDNS